MLTLNSKYSYLIKRCSEHNQRQNVWKYIDHVLLIFIKKKRSRLNLDTRQRERHAPRWCRHLFCLCPHRHWHQCAPRDTSLATNVILLNKQTFPFTWWYLINMLSGMKPALLCSVLSSWKDGRAPQCMTVTSPAVWRHCHCMNGATSSGWTSAQSEFTECSDM